MVLRQTGHFFFEPQTYDEVNQATHAYKERVKVTLAGLHCTEVRSLARRSTSWRRLLIIFGNDRSTR